MFTSLTHFHFQHHIFPTTNLTFPLFFQSYLGHVFWDQETWMFPPLLVLHSDLGRTILDTRKRTATSAARNAQLNDHAGLQYPWESAFTGVVHPTASSHPFLSFSFRYCEALKLEYYTQGYFYICHSLRVVDSTTSYTFPVRTGGIFYNNNNNNKFIYIAP